MLSVTIKLTPAIDSKTRMAHGSHAAPKWVDSNAGDCLLYRGGGVSEAVVEVVLDGYSAPLTAGHFAALIREGYYDGLSLQSGEAAWYVGGSDVREPTATSLLPLPFEIMQMGEFEPRYRIPLDVQDGEFPVLPMSVYGSLAMARDIDDNGSDPSKFFFYLYDRRTSGLGGLSFEEGNFAVFGYVTGGEELLPQLRMGDVIASARLVSGENKLTAVGGSGVMWDVGLVVEGWLDWRSSGGRDEPASGTRRQCAGGADAEGLGWLSEA
ncbi:hypothetical protein CYMTET_50648 [Cymbomonas tetramitiformis]|uniref:PPIase cyclophilin-type domain-containing protein n=1 Tax=Cymbomonas tetramitiformis TaxID=36881 RepID=A0AAE0BML7_9CHLO|nr:hypothetical protein CYMTET_50648 [Cymbomonas tetramitiformis]